MKNKLLVASMLLGSFAFSQNRSIKPAGVNHLKLRPSQSLSHEKSLVCQDTLRYPQIKEQILGTSNFAIFDAWQSYSESISMGFQNSTSLTINKIEFFGGNSPDGVATVTVQAAVYDVNASFTPTTLVGSGTLSISDTNYSYRYVNLTAPVTVTGNYAVVITATNANGVVRYYVNDPSSGQFYDETLGHYKSTFYTTSNGTYVTVPALTTGFTGGPYNFEPLVAPIVSYSINTAFTASPASTCPGSPVSFTSTTTPTSVFQNRFESYQAFSVYFGTQVSDSSFAYLFDDNSNPGWGSSLSHTYSAAGTYTDTLFSLGGFWASCADYGTQTVTINPVDDASFTYPSYSICAGSSNPVATAATAGTFSSTAGLNFVSASTGQINTSTSAAGTYVITHTTSGACPSTSTQTMVINAADNASFTYPSYTICSGSSNPVATASTAGTFSSTSGLNFVSSSTGEIDMSTSSDGTYVITHTTSGTCPATATQTLTITAAPDASFSYSAAAFCQNDTDPVPSFTTGSAGAFSSSAGIVVSNNGTIDVSASTPGTYTISNTIAASGSCPATTATQNVTINPLPAVSFASVGNFCVTDSPVTLSGTPASGTFSGTGVSGASFDPQVAGAGSFTLTYSYTDGNGCSASATQSVTVNGETVPAFPSTASYCVGENASLSTTSSNSITGTWSPSTVSTTTAGTTTYTFTPNAGQCATAATIDITVNANPVVTFDNVNDLCVYNAAVTLTGTPSGGTFAGSGVSGASFDPSVSGTGTFTLTYSFTDGNGCSAVQSQDVMVDACLGLDENSVLVVSAYPNPATALLNVSYSAANSNVKIISADGKILFEKNYSGDVETAIDLSHFAPAVYDLIVTTESGIHVSKILKQ